MSNKKQMVKYSELLTYYLKLFTKKQQTYLIDYFLHDLSLKEIANKHHVSVMAISDSINRSKKTLNDYEKHLLLYEKACKRRKVYNQIQQESIKKQLMKIDKF
ncbi:MAG: hypothetical protein LBF36_02695 [Mycoplasmataceae bacterium]|jgi:predicted DNA-binding protein YlxM (UPF0122 family)|nr:hypothetical protein [Mycoplasmataceae bacterium]